MEWNEIRAALGHMSYPFPAAAAREAHARWDEFAPHFLAELERVANGGSTLLDDIAGEWDGLFSFAVHFAAEKRDVRAFAPLVRAGHCPAERAEELFGDDVGMEYGRILASVCDGDLAPLRALAEDREAGLWCRFAGLHAQVVRVIEGDADRDEVLAYIGGLCEREAAWLRQAGSDVDEAAAEFLTWAADSCCELGPAPLLENIRGWFAEGLIEPTVTGLDWFEREAAKPVAQILAEAAENNANRYLRDGLAEIASWHCYDKPEPPRRVAPKPLATPVRAMPKVGRNDPCPCGSGKKFKKCCGGEDNAPTVDDSKDGGVGRALDWLRSRHGKAMKTAVAEMVQADLEPAEQARLRECADEDWQGIEINSLEWLLAEGELVAKGAQHRVADLLLAPGGPVFTPGQRRWIEQLRRQPLRLYDVTEVKPGRGMRLCDALAPESAPIWVQEISGSAGLRVGSLFGARLMEVDGHWELSGAGYPFAPLMNAAVLAEARAVTDDPELRGESLAREISDIIRRQWIAQYARPMPLPTMVDSHSGEALLFVTDHYRVLDRAALDAALATQSNIETTPAGGWVRLLDCADGQVRQTMAINPGKHPDRIEVFFKTQAYADTGRPWFEALADGAVEFAGRVLSDPKGLMRDMMTKGKDNSPSAMPDLPPDVIASAIEQVLHRSYANWCDEPIPALGDRTPRQAMDTPAGLERVKGLLRSYEAGEKEQATAQRRREISFEFLWRGLGLERDPA